LALWLPLLLLVVVAVVVVVVVLLHTLLTEHARPQQRLPH